MERGFAPPNANDFCADAEGDDVGAEYAGTRRSRSILSATSGALVRDATTSKRSFSLTWTKSETQLYSNKATCTHRAQYSSDFLVEPKRLAARVRHGVAVCVTAQRAVDVRVDPERPEGKVEVKGEEARKREAVVEGARPANGSGGGGCRRLDVDGGVSARLLEEGAGPCFFDHVEG